MNTKHTPGPWYGKDGQIYPESTGNTLALISYFDEENQQHKANQRLIAAAPELLQMVCDLKKCIERLTADDVSQFDRDRESEWIGEAHELLHKASPDYYKNANQ